jgi:hypothetical protein
VSVNLPLIDEGTANFQSLGIALAPVNRGAEQRLNRVFSQSN